MQGIDITYNCFVGLWIIIVRLKEVSQLKIKNLETCLCEDTEIESHCHLSTSWCFIFKTIFGQPTFAVFDIIQQWVKFPLHLQTSSLNGNYDW